MIAAIRRLDAGEAAARIGELADILIDAVDGDASVGFLPPLKRADAEAFWRRMAADARRGARMLLVAEDAGRLLGTVVLEFVAMPNQPHRCAVSKLLVLRAARRRGLARRLMAALEDEALHARRSLLVLDTRKGDAAEPLYEKLGYVRAGVIPRFALNGEGGLDDTVIFYKELAPKRPPVSAGGKAGP